MIGLALLHRSDISPISIKERINTPSPQAPPPDSGTTSPPSLSNPALAYKKARTDSYAATSSQAPPSARPQYHYRAAAITSPQSLPGAMQASYLTRINQPLAYSLVRAPILPVTIAVIDTGFALNHEVFNSKWAINANDPIDSIDNDNNGYVDDYKGWDFVSQDNQPSANISSPSSSHGTLVASLAIAQNERARILPLQVLDDNGDGYTNAVAEAIHYAVNSGASVINISLGSIETDPYLEEQIDYAISQGVVVVAAAGNDGCNCMLFPARYAPVIAVGASNSFDRRASFSSYGPSLDLLAPGTAGEVCGAIYNNTTPNTGYSCSYSGTSLSAPIVSGTVSLLRQHFSQAGVTDIISSITRGAVRVENMLNNDFTVTEGFGRLNPVSSIGLLSIKAPGGLLISKHIASIGSAERLNSTCLGYPGSICQIIFNNGNGQTISLPSQTVLSQQPGLPYASWNWSPIELGIPKGKWTVQAQSTFDNQIIYSASDTLTIQ